MTKDENKTIKVINKGGPLACMFFMTYIGAAVYFVQQSVGFGEFIVALLKAVVWPAYVTYEVLGLLHL
ncbi:MAG: hypothetical protein AAB834_07525 [Patescibacteria group bacterium]|mgnify:CR=1 FL=1